MTTCISQKREINRHSTADLYRTTRNWLKCFSPQRELTFRDVTPGLLDRFILFLQTAGLKTNTVNTYISNFRAVYNCALREKHLSTQQNPFEHILLRREQTLSRATTADTIEQIACMEQPTKLHEEAADYCTFCYLACGMPFVDLAHLTQRNIQNGEIVYNRAKTGIRIRVGITAGMQCILDKYAVADAPYLFPILSTKEVSHEAYKSILRAYNLKLKEIGQQLPSPILLTSYTVRHTWATEALRKHTPVAIISQALGHTSEKTTRFYLAQLDQSELNRANAIITGSMDMIVAGIKKTLFAK